MKLSEIQDETDIERYAIDNDMSKMEVRELLMELSEMKGGLT